MKIVTIIKSAFAVVALAAMTACGGGSGSGGLTHAQLANDFVYHMNVDGGYDVTLMKANTYQYNYIVVYDYFYGTYDAYDLTGYYPGANINTFIFNNSYWTYYDLWYVGGNVYQDPYTGTQFTKDVAGSKDLQSNAAAMQQLQVNKSSRMLTTEFGMTAGRSQEVAKLATQVAFAPKGSLTVKDYDNFAVEAVGTSITDLINAKQQKDAGNSAAYNQALESFQALNGLTAEATDKILATAVRN